MEINKIYQGDTLEVLKQLPDEFVDCIVTSPPYYGLRDYGVEGQIGLEKTLNEYLDKMLSITAELKRVLKKTGTMWWNHGDSYGTSHGAGELGKYDKNPDRFAALDNSEKGRSPGPEKCLMLQAHRLVIRMIDEQGWILRNTIIWHKPNCMPSSAKDRFTVDYEPVFFLTKSKKYWFETQYEPLQESSLLRAKYNSHSSKTDKGIHGGMNLKNQLKVFEKINKGELSGRNKRCVWKIPTKPYSEAHFATYPPTLIEPMTKAGCPEFICKKCGKARTTTTRTTTTYKNYKHPAGKQPDKTFTTNAPRWESKTEITGLTNCHCNAGWNAGIVLDPFMGSGTTALVARNLGRNYLGIELNPEYIKLIEKRLRQDVLI